MDTKEQARKLIPLLQAYADGKELQWHNHKKEWVRTYRPPTMDDRLDEWRVKPEPREIVRCPSVFVALGYRCVIIPEDWDCEEVRVIEVLKDE